MKRKIAINLLLICLMLSFTVAYANTPYEDGTIPAVIAAILTLLFLVICFYFVGKHANKKREILPTVEIAPDSFDNEYSSIMHKFGVDLKEQNKGLNILQAISIIMIAIILIFDLILQCGEPNSDLELVAILLIFGAFAILVILVPLMRKMKIDYRKDYKEKVINGIIKSLSLDLKYAPQEISEQENQATCELYESAKFDELYFNVFNADDCIEGTLEEGTKVQIADLVVKLITGSGKSRAVTDRFQGLYVHTKLNTDIDGNIVISEFKVIPNIDKENINLDSSKFEEYFAVYSEDRILATRFLTADVMEMFVEYREKYNMSFDVSIRKNDLNIRIHSGRMFEPIALNNNLDKQLLFRYYSVLEFTINLTDELVKRINQI